MMSNYRTYLPEIQLGNYQNEIYLMKLMNNNSNTYSPLNHDTLLEYKNLINLMISMNGNY